MQRNNWRRRCQWWLSTLCDLPESIQIGVYWMNSNKNILISGAGISGLTLAYWLQQWGFTPTVIEKRPNLDQRG